MDGGAVSYVGWWFGGYGAVVAAVPSTKQNNLLVGVV